MRRTAWVAIVSLGTATACGVAAGSGPGSGGGCTPSATQICAVNLAFSPGTDTVAAGTTVRWMNDDNVAHTTTSSAVPIGAATWDKPLAAGAQDSVTLNVVGTYQYYCRFHGSPGSGMHGTIVVQ